MGFPESDPVAERVRGHFQGLVEVGEKLGEGVTGAVFRAERGGSVHALKVLAPRYLRDDVKRKRFALEADLLRSLDHPRIVKLHETGLQDDWPYMLCELAEGGTASDLVRDGPGPWARALAIGEQILEGLVEVHARKIVHRNLKPANVLLALDGTVRISDFGLAAVEPSSARLTRPGRAVGTPAYLAPEVLGGQKADARADLFSLGVVLFELISGRLPWEDASLAERLLTREAPRLRRFVPLVPGTVEALIATALEPCPSGRFPSARTFLVALRATRDRAERPPVP